RQPGPHVGHLDVVLVALVDGEGEVLLGALGPDKGLLAGRVERGTPLSVLHGCLVLSAKGSRSAGTQAVSDGQGGGVLLLGHSSGDHNVFPTPSETGEPVAGDRDGVLLAHPRVTDAVSLDGAVYTVPGGDTDYSLRLGLGRHGCGPILSGSY